MTEQNLTFTGTLIPTDEWPQTGDLVYPTVIPEHDGFTGRAATVIDHEQQNTYDAEGNKRLFVQLASDATVTFYCTEWVTAKTLPAPVEKALRYATSNTSLYQRQADRHRADATAYRETLLDMARFIREQKDEQAWCDDGYQAKVEEFLDSVERPSIHEYLDAILSVVRPYAVEVEVTRTQTQVVTIVVGATNEDAARDKVNDMDDDYLLNEAEDYDEEAWDTESGETRIQRVRESQQ